MSRQAKIKSYQEGKCLLACSFPLHPSYIQLFSVTKNSFPNDFPEAVGAELPTISCLLRPGLDQVISIYFDAQKLIRRVSTRAQAMSAPAQTVRSVRSVRTLLEFCCSEKMSHGNRSQRTGHGVPCCAHLWRYGHSTDWTEPSMAQSAGRCPRCVA